jgi:pseudaminic acid cytidylyltransferase
MRHICIIPARGGSKRIPRKNIKLFRGYPIIKWSIEAALRSEAFESVIVSTDDREIADVAAKYGAKIPLMRPKELSDDHSDTQSVINHMIDQIDATRSKLDLVCCLYATAPFVEPEDLQKAVQLAKSSSDKTIFPVTRFSYPIQRALKRDINGNTNFAISDASEKRSQDLEEMYHDSGQYYIAEPKKWRNEKNILEDSKTILLPSWKVQDIDNQEDWIRAEIMHEVLERYRRANWPAVPKETW